MKIEKYYCDKCHREIARVVYTLSCTARVIRPQEATLDEVQEAAAQNVRQSNAEQMSTVHLCWVCKDKITDGVFIV